MNLERTVSTVDRRYKEDESRRDRWAEYRRIYEGEYWKEGMDEFLSKVDSGKLFSTVSQLAPLMTDNRPVWSVVARDPVLQPVIEQWSKALKYLWDVLKMSSKINNAYQDALLMEQGILQVEWDDDKEEVAVEVVDPRHLVFAPGDYDELEDCPWVCKRKAYTLSDVRRTYPDKAEDIVGDTDMKNEYDDDVLSSTTQWVTIYELWMRDDTVEEDLETEDAKKEGEKVKKKLKYPNGRFITFTKNGKEGKPVLLDDHASPYGHGKPPYVMIYDYRLSHSIWGLGEGRHLMPIVDELNDMLQSISGKFRNTARPNYAVDPYILEENDIKNNFHRGFQFFSKKNVRTEDVRYPGIDLMPQAGPLQSELQYINYLSDLIEDLTSVTAILKGQSGKRERQTAQEWSGLYEAGHTRTRLRVRNMEWSVGRLLELILHIAMENYNEEHVFSTREDTAVEPEYGRISNTRQMAEDLVMQDVDEKFTAMEEDTDGEETPMMYGETNRDDAKRSALERLIQALPVEQNKVLIRFMLTMQSQSTLPTDVQSKANMMIQLGSLGFVDAKAVLETLQITNADEIIERMQQNLLAAQQAAPQQGQGQIFDTNAQQESNITPIQ